LLSAPCSDANKALFTAQQFHGTPRIWWDHYHACSRLVMLLPGMNSGPLSERTTFQRDSLSESSMNFDFDPGNPHSYAICPSLQSLCQYAGYHADTDARKRDHFRRGLNTKLKERLNLVKANTFNELVNMAITQEDCISAHEAKKKRKTPTGP
jgi:hypothetical protein